MSRASEPRCPLCRKPAASDQSPFCSAECRDRDLINWLDEAYVAPGPPADADALDNS